MKEYILIKDKELKIILCDSYDIVRFSDTENAISFKINNKESNIIIKRDVEIMLPGNNSLDRLFNGLVEYGILSYGEILTILENKYDIKVPFNSAIYRLSGLKEPIFTWNMFEKLYNVSSMLALQIAIDIIKNTSEVSKLIIK